MDKFKKLSKALKSSAKPSDPKLYSRVKSQVKADPPGGKWPSAYASAAVVKKYKAAGGKYN